jgi:hypothetical protein
MAVLDDLRQLAQQDVVYLTRFLSGSQGTGRPEIFRGRLHEALGGSWIFNTTTAPVENGVAGINLGPQQDSWSSTEFPSEGLVIAITIVLFEVNVQGVGSPVSIFEEFRLLSVIPGELTN